jgi:hypothetical protein
MKPLLIVLAVFVLSGCAPGPSLGKVTDVVVIESGLGKPEDANDRCESFRPSPAQVREFLGNSIIVGSIHSFRWSPCYARGTASIGGQHSEWTMGPYGLGGVEILSHGVVHNVASRDAIRAAYDRMNSD